MNKSEVIGGVLIVIFGIVAITYMLVQTQPVKVETTPSNSVNSSTSTMFGLPDSSQD